MPRFRNPIISTANIPDGAITTAKLANLAVTTPKLALLAVGTAQIDNLAVTAAKIANLAVGTAQIDNLAVTAAKIANATITNAQIGSLNADKITAGTITALRYRTASSGERLEIRGEAAESFIRIFNSAGTQVALMGWDAVGFGTTQLTFATLGGAGNFGITIDTDGVLAASAGTVGIIAVGDMSLNANQITTSSANRLFVPQGTSTFPGVTLDATGVTGIYSAGTNRVGLTGGSSVQAITGNSGNPGWFPVTPTTASAANLFQGSSLGQMLRSTSSARYKQAVRPWDRRASVLELTPSLFRSALPHDDGRRLHLGLIAEDVAAVFPLAVIRDHDGRPDSINWNAITAGVLSELQHLERRVAILEGV